MKYYIRSRSVPIVFGDGWLVKIEKAAFGWKTDGQHTESEEYDEHTTHNYTEYYGDIPVDVTEHRVERKTRFTTYQDFYRISPYSYNIIFHALELFSTFFSFIRRIVMTLAGWLWWLLIGIAIFAAVLDQSMLGTAIQAVVGVLLLYALVVILPSLLIALVAYLVRKLFRIDENVNDSLERNGYDTDW